MINSWALLIIKAIDGKYVEMLNSSSCSKHIIKTACKTSDTYKRYDYFKKAYKHDAEHDVAKTLQDLVFLCQYGALFSKDIF